ncbi:monocarboxylate transporter 14-like [Sipha flava]|uniref:Monocarboxylate transporter 14-like n=2 Tax=Sipha flava TaxID=143950 RepID=A0A8B8G3Q2_9HEMI|nr:monocarboxylate transporter 14-like [Sipha flava]
MVCGTALPDRNDEQPDESSYMLRDKKPSSHGHRIVAPDGDWGWYVVSGCAFANFLLPGMLISFGSDVLDQFTEIHGFNCQFANRWILTTFDLMFYVAGSLSCILRELLSFRSVTILGGLLAFVGMITSSLANSVLHLFVSYGIMVGFGAGACYPAGILLVNEYFDRYRGLANGLSLVGTTIGSFALPIYLKFLTVSYGYRGGILIASGMILNVIACALTYVPSEKYVRSVGTTAPMSSSSLSTSAVSIETRESATSAASAASDYYAPAADAQPPPSSPSPTAPSVNNCGGDTEHRGVASTVRRLFGGKPTVGFAAVSAVNTLSHLAFATFVATVVPSAAHTTNALRFAVANAAGRVLMPAVSDMLSPRGSASVYLYAVAVAIGGAVLLTTAATLVDPLHRPPQSSSLSCLLVAAALASGAVVALEPLVVVRVLGSKRLAASYSTTLFGKGVTQLAVHLLFTSSDRRHPHGHQMISTSVALYALGSCLVATAVAWTAAFLYKSHYATSKNSYGRYVITL